MSLINLKAPQAELKDDTTILVDKVKLIGFDVKSVESISFLEANGFIVNRRNCSEECMTDASGANFNSIRCKLNELFNNFSFIIQKDGKINSAIEITVPYDQYHNLNCMTVVTLKERLKLVQQVLSDYGIVVDFTNARISQMEINKTIPLDLSADKYYRCLTLMRHLMGITLHAKYDEHGRCSEKKDYVESFTLMTATNQQGLLVKCYDKSRQLADKFNIIVRNNYLRFEIVFQSTATMMSQLGSELLRDITDEIINDYFHQFIEDKFLMPYQAYSAKVEKELCAMIINVFNANPQYTFAATLIKQLLSDENEHKFPIVLDYRDIQAAIDAVVKKRLKPLKFNDKQYRYDLKKRIANECRNSVLDKMDGDKMKELIEKLK